MTFKIAVIGCGWVSTDCHGPAYREYAQSHSDVILSACCDIDPQRAETFRSRFGFQRAYTDYRKMLDREQPQAVALNVPPQLISPIGCDILQRGFPLISEKPPGRSVAELDCLIAAARSTGVIHQVAFNRRFMPLSVAMKEQLSGHTVHHLDLQMARFQRLDENFGTTAIHAIDASRFLIESDYARAEITYQELPTLGPGVTNVLLDGQFANGVTIHLAIYPVTGVSIERTTVFALDHTFFLHAGMGPDAPGRLLHYENGRIVSDLDAHQFTGRREEYVLNGFHAEDAAFIDAVQAGRQPDNDFESCRQSVAMMQHLLERKTRFP